MTIARVNRVRTRIVSSNVWVNGESVNWKSDYHKYKGFTYAQVLQRGQKPFIAEKHPGSNQDTNLTKVHTTPVDPDKGKVLSQVKSNNDVKKVFNKSSKPGKDYGTNPVTCYNRYAVFHESDGVVPILASESGSNPIKAKEKSNHKVDSKSTPKNASQNDTYDKLKLEACVKVRSQNRHEESLHRDPDTNYTSKYDLSL